MSDGLREYRMEQKEVMEERVLFLFMADRISKFGLNNWTDEELEVVKRCAAVARQMKDGIR